MDQLVTILFPDEYFQRTEESVSMWLRSWRSKSMDQQATVLIVNEYFLPGNGAQRKLIFHIASAFYGASDKLYHLRSRGRSHSSDASLRKKKEDTGTTNLLVPHRGMTIFRNQRGSVTNGKDGTRAPPSGRMDTYRVSLSPRWKRTCQCPPVKTP
ncbi:hypothetical protein TNCV_4178791 [Trichonephila clavipes]|nr:hypothetical protein TNCV_4178791 [Trichonephila clavipes]